MNFPFRDSENTAVFTCSHVLENNHSICYVTHDEDDGGWQFLCGQAHNEEEARIVSLKEIFEKDPSIGVLSEMPLGCAATREAKNLPWNWLRK